MKQTCSDELIIYYLKEYSVILTTSFYDTRSTWEKERKKKGVILKILVDAITFESFVWLCGVSFAP